MNARTLFLATLSLFLFCGTLTAQIELSWEALPGPSGDVPFQIFCTDSSGIVWGGVEFGKIFYSTNSGVSWQRTPLSITPVGVLPGRANRRYTVDNFAGVWVSDGNPNQWEALIPSGLGTNIADVWITPEETIYAYGDQFGRYVLLQLAREGEVWDTVYRFKEGVIGKVHFYQAGSRVQFQVNDSLYSITNGQVESSKINIGVHGFPRSVVSDSAGVFYAVMDDWVWNSRDSGVTWNRYKFLDWTGITSIAVTPSRSFVGVGYYGIYRAADSASEWEQIVEETLYDYAVHSVPSSGDLLVQSRQNLYRSSDGGTTWEESSEGITAVQLSKKTLLRTSSGNIVVGTSSTGVKTSTDVGQTWISTLDTVYVDGPSSYNPSAILDIAESGDGLLFAATSGGLFRSSDQGESWERVSTLNVSVREVEWGDGTLFVFSVNTKGKLEISTSNDGGESWETIGSLSSTPPYDFIFNESGSSLIAKVSASQWLESTNGGKTWSRTVYNHPDPANVSLVSDAERDRLLVLVNAGTLGRSSFTQYSTDRGTTWQLLGDSLYDVRQLDDLLPLPNGGLMLFGHNSAPTGDSLLYYLAPGGDQWQEIIVDGSRITSWRSVVLEDGRILVGTPFDGLYVSSWSVLSVDDHQPISSRSSMSAEYGGEFVVLRSPTGLPPLRSCNLFDELGRSVQVWNGEDLLSGSGEAYLKLQGVSAGLYFLQVKSVDEGHSVIPLPIDRHSR